MTWTIELHPEAAKQLKKLAKKDPVTARRITSTLRELAELDDPRDRAKPMTGPLVGLWRYRVGDWRIVVDIHHARYVVIALDIDHRSTIYKR